MMNEIDVDDNNFDSDEEKWKFILEYVLQNLLLNIYN
jgi:hypothetical protein